ncbi:MAG: protein translocase subunit SecD [Coriobacteriia bacterium]|nr:protein translocase subunit SecD [Coriobacteriia bacterium]MBS5477638.1 protein translocase subunit SecD [Coriobacteriia bacterium]
MADRDSKREGSQERTHTTASREWAKQTGGAGQAKRRAPKKGGSGKRRPAEVRRYAGTLIALAVILVCCVIGFTPLGEKITQGLDLQGGVSVIMTASKPDGSAVTDEDMEKAVSIVQNRVNSLGASEATVQKQGSNSILVQIPGATDAQQAIDTIGRTGMLEFVDLMDVADQDALLKINNGQSGVELKQGSYTAFMTGDDISNVTISQQSAGSAYYAVNITLNSHGTQQFADVTKVLAPTNGRIAIVLDGVVNSAPAVQSEIANGQVAITGNYTLDEAKELKTVLDSGSLPVTLDYSESRVVGPTLGQDSLTQGLIAIAVGFAVVVCYLLFFYQGIGLITVTALVVFGIVYLGLLALLSHFGAFALSLPGLAGVVLTIGMAADSSILVLERFREEIRMGKAPRKASESGSKHGIMTALDAGVVTLISALGLFLLGVGSVKGFGLTLALGVLCSFFTLLCYTTPVLRLLGRSVIEKNPGFWGVRHDMEEAKAAQQARLGKGGELDA